MTPLRLGSRYQLEERMGEGGLGVVWRGRDVVTGAGFAIKVLRAEHARDPGAVARFVRERTALLAFRHPNVVALHDMIVEGDRLALVMELAADGDLAAHRQRRGGTLDPAEATDIMAQVCAALASAHAAGIVHRDLKPANILLDGGRVRLTDFGIAQIAGEPPLTSEGVFVGSLHYLAPEVIQGDEPTPACDCYAVGITLYELLSGEPPYTGQAAAVMHGHLYLAPERPDGIPESCWRLISACLDKDPRRRPSAAELEEALRAGPWQAAIALESLSSAEWQRTGTGEVRNAEATGPRVLAVSADPVTVTSRVVRRRRRDRRSYLALAALAAVAVIVLALTRSLGPSGPAASPAVTVTEKVTAAGAAATLGTLPGAAGGRPSPQPGSNGPSPPGTSTRPGSSPRHTGTAQPPARRPGGSASPSAPVPGSSGPAPTTAAPSSPGPVPTTSMPTPAVTTPSPTGPADTPWQCGSVAAATLSSGKATSQTLQACIRVHAGQLDLTGTLSGTKTGWHEQIILVLEDSAQDGNDSYTSATCSTSVCTFDTSLVPASGKWTVRPEWTKNGSFRSAGDEPGYVTF